MTNQPNCKRVSMVSLGCPKNQVDAEMLLTDLCRAGYEISPDPDQADVVVINTCAFIEDAKRESIETILSYCLNRGKTGPRVVVTGCLAERYRKEVMREIPELDGVFGIGANKNIVACIDDVLAGEKRESFPKKEELPLQGSREVLGSGYLAYIKIAEGCSNNCTYCAIPAIRGPYRSRPREDVLAEAVVLAEKGIRELVVVAQDPTRYGEDLYPDYRLSHLLRALCEIEGFRWIRVLYTYPERIDDDLIAAVREEEKLVKYFDLPLQHISDEVLRRMNRRLRGDEVRALIAKLRREIPGVTLRTTLIVGFPGESEAQYEELSQFVKETEFDRLGCFCYSAEEGTPAAQFPDQIDEETKQRRRDGIMLMQAEISGKKNRALIGRQMTVIVDDYDETAGRAIGRSERDVFEVDGTISFPCSKPLEPGTFVTVTITGADDYDLAGEICKE